MNPIRSRFGRVAAVLRDSSLRRSWPLFAASAVFAAVSTQPLEAHADKDKRITCARSPSVSGACVIPNDQMFPVHQITTLTAHWASGASNTAQACILYSSSQGGACDTAQTGGTAVSLSGVQRDYWGSGYSSHFPYLAVNNTSALKGIFAYTTNDSLPSSTTELRTACAWGQIYGLGGVNNDGKSCAWSDSSAFRANQIDELRVYYYQTNPGTNLVTAQACHAYYNSNGGACTTPVGSGTKPSMTPGNILINDPWVGVSTSHFKYVKYTQSGANIKGIRATIL